MPEVEALYAWFKEASGKLYRATTHAIELQIDQPMFPGFQRGKQTVELPCHHTDCISKFILHIGRLKKHTKQIALIK